MRNLKTNERGYALLATILIVILIVSGLTGAFLNMTRQGRSIQRLKDRAEMSLYAQAVVEAVESLFYSYVITHATYPNFSSEQKNEVCDPCVSTDTAGFFRTKALANIQSLTSHMPYIKDPANLNSIPEVRVRQIGSSTEPADAVREYEVTVAMVNTRSGERLAVKQKLEVRAGTLFDFSIFYDDDLEIAPGPESSIQGPIFTNGDVYLMSGRTSDFATNAGLKFLLPYTNPLNPHPQNYILKSHGDIYFYFKRAMAENYMLNSQEFSGADAYIANLPPYYLEALGVSDLASLKARVAGGEKLPEVTPPWNVHQSDWCDYSKIYAGCQLEKDGTENRFFPYFYYFSNGAELGNYNGVIPVTRISVYDSSGASPLNIGTTPTGVLVQSYSRFAAGTVYHAPRMGPYAYPWTAYRVSVSPAFDVTNFPKLYSGWSPEHPVATRKNVTGESHPLKEKMDNPLKDPQWGGVSSQGNILIMDNVDPKALPIGVANPDPSNINPNHLLIEPVEESDSVEIKNLKYQGIADIDIRCANSLCTAHSVCVKGEYPCFSSSAAPEEFIDYGWIYDYRLKGRYRTLTLFMDKLRKYFLDRIPRTDATGTALGNEYFRDGISIYIQTLPMLDSLGVPQGDAEDNSVRLVRVKDSAAATYPGAIPSALQSGKITGMTLATNGRLWVQGDFNIYYGYNESGAPGGVCSYDEIIQQTCKVPPVAIFSDSFGILSKEWKDAYGASTSLDSRNVGNDLSLNTAVVTGFLESRLERRYSSLPGPRWNTNGIDAKYLTGPVNGIYYLKVSHPDFDLAKTSMSYWPEWAKTAGDTEIPVVTCEVDKTTYTPPLTASVAGCLGYVGVPSVALHSSYVLTGYSPNCWNCLGVRNPSYTGVPTGEGSAVSHTGDTCAADVASGAPLRHSEYRNIGACRDGSDLNGAVIPTENPYYNSPCRITATNGAIPGEINFTEIYNAWRRDDAGNHISLITTNESYFSGLPSMNPYEKLDSKSNDVDPITNQADPSNDIWDQDRGGFLIYKVPGASPGEPGGQLKAAGKYRFFLFCPYGICSNAYPELKAKNGWFVSCSGADSAPSSGACSFEGRNDVFKPEYKNFLEPLYERLQMADQHGNPLYWYRNYSSSSPGYRYRDFLVIKLVNPYPAASIDPGSSSQVIGQYYFKNRTCHPALGTSCSSGANKIYLRACDISSSGLGGYLNAIEQVNYPPNLHYSYPYYERLYDVKYSGGYENLINFQENWRDLSDPSEDIRRRVFFSGVTTAPWFSEELKKSDGAPAYYGTDYYRAPERTYDYNETLRDDPPPGTPKLFSVAQKTGQKELDPDNLDYVDSTTSSGGS
ncbi:MAG TPA: type II secretion system protein [Candidatus Omnitrophota bacterium]|nr:type II secretion system protein [Candidatus Omnitrophota bacterium]